MSGLDPHVSYSVRVKALSLDGRFGNFSDAVYISRVDEGILRTSVIHGPAPQVLAVAIIYGES